MKKVLKIILLLILTLIVAFVINYKFGLSTHYNFFSAKHDISKGKIQLIGYGLPSIDRNWVSKNYGFRVVEAGCTVSDEEINGIDQYNKVVRRFLDEKYGNSWEENYNRQCDSIEKIIFKYK